jgi:hypothetical protein
MDGDSIASVSASVWILKPMACVAFCEALVLKSVPLLLRFQKSSRVYTGVRYYLCYYLPITYPLRFPPVFFGDRVELRSTYRVRLPDRRWIWDCARRSTAAINHSQRTLALLVRLYANSVSFCLVSLIALINHQINLATNSGGHGVYLLTGSSSSHYGVLSVYYRTQGRFHIASWTHGHGHTGRV